MKTRRNIFLLALVLSFGLMAPAFAQQAEPQAPQQAEPPMAAPQQAEPPMAAPQQAEPPMAAPQQAEPPAPTPAATAQNQPEITSSTESLRPGEKAKVEGVIVRRDPEALIVRTPSGADMMVKLTNSTKVEERKSNPFRGAQKYNVTQLMRGLPMVAEGKADSSGVLVANKIRFTKEEYRTAEAIHSQVTPVEGRVQSAETRLSASEANAQRLSGQIEELNGVANAARGSAKNAQGVADMALNGVHTTNDRINDLDNYQVRNKAVIHFKVGSARLSPEGKRQLDELAQAASGEKGYLIQVAGFASSDGNEALNRELSRRRAEAVVDYLGSEHNIPLYRITMPFGYGERNPVADNSTRNGREENRRVEVSVLVNKGLSEQPLIPSHSSTESPVSSQAGR